MASDFLLRPVTRDELPAFTRTDLIAFGERTDPPRLELDWTSLELDRTLAAFDGDEILYIDQREVPQPVRLSSSPSS